MSEEVKVEITAEQREDAERQITEQHKIIDYDTREYPVEVIVSKYLNAFKKMIMIFLCLTTSVIIHGQMITNQNLLNLY